MDLVMVNTIFPICAAANAAPACNTISYTCVAISYVETLSRYIRTVFFL